MKGVKLGIPGLSAALAGIAFSTANVFGFAGGAIGLVLALIGCFVKDQ